MSECDNIPNPPEVEAAFPAGSVPENKVTDISALCSYGMRAHVMTGFLRQLLINHFADPKNIEEPRIRKHIEAMGAWAPVDEDSNHDGILVESITRWLPAAADKRPAVLIKRNDWKWAREGIGDFGQGNSYTGSSTYSAFWHGSHTLFCLAQNGAEAEFLTTEVIRFLAHYAPAIRTEMNLHKFNIESVGGVGEVEEVTKGYAAPVTVAYVSEESWTLQPHAPRLKRVVFRASELLSG